MQIEVQIQKGGGGGGGGGGKEVLTLSRKITKINTGADPLKNHKPAKPAFNVGPVKCHFNGVLLAGP